MRHGSRRPRAGPPASARPAEYRSVGARGTARRCARPSAWDRARTTALPPNLSSAAAEFAADDFAGRGQRQFIDEYHLTRRLVPGEPLPDEGANLVGEFRPSRYVSLRHDK